MASRRIPPKDMVVSIMKEVMHRRKVVTTLHELWILVLANLKKINKNFVISSHRVKQIAVELPEIEVKVKTRRGKGKLNVCPVCGSELISVYGKNLLGKKVQTGYKCKKCGFKTGIKTSSPMKYIFVRKAR